VGYSARCSAHFWPVLILACVQERRPVKREEDADDRWLPRPWPCAHSCCYHRCPLTSTGRHAVAVGERKEMISGLQRINNREEQLDRDRLGVLGSVPAARPLEGHWHKACKGLVQELTHLSRKAAAPPAQACLLGLSWLRTWLQVAHDRI